MLLTSLRDHPMRTVDWRWQIVMYLLDRRMRLTRSYGDIWLAQAKRFACDLRNASTEGQQFRIDLRFPAIFGAYRIYRETTHKSFRHELEARLLAAEPASEIRNKMRIEASTIEAYQNLFFDVASRLRNQSCIMHVVLRPAMRSMSEREPEGLWKMFGYFCGATVLDRLVYRFRPQNRPASPGELSAFLRDDIREQIQLKALIAAHSVAVNSQSQMELLDIYQRMLDFELDAGSGGDSGESMRQGIQAMLESLPWTRDREDAKKQSSVHPIEDTGVGLRTDERILAASGQLPQDFEAMLASAKFPD